MFNERNWAKRNPTKKNSILQHSIEIWPQKLDVLDINSKILRILLILDLPIDNIAIDKCWEVCNAPFVPKKWLACSCKFISAAFRTYDCNPSLEVSSLQCEEFNTLFHRIVQFPKATFIVSKTFQIINFPIAKPNIINIITSKVETTPFLQNLKILGITAAFWNIHILTLNERNTKKIMSFQEILNRIKASIIDLVYSFSHTHNWPRKISYRD